MSARTAHAEDVSRFAPRRVNVGIKRGVLHVGFLQQLVVNEEEGHDEGGILLNRPGTCNANQA